MGAPAAPPDGSTSPRARRSVITHPAVTAVGVLVGYGLLGVLWAGRRDARENSFCGDGETAYFWIGAVALTAVVYLCGMLARSWWNRRALTATVAALVALICAPILWLTWLFVSVYACLTF